MKLKIQEDNYMKIVIINGDEKVIDVAWAAGFTSLSVFNRFFKKQMGQTPSEYRKNQSKPSIN
ncbi:helix-turn-helix domain-containing protein [Blautia sp. MSJ-9]|nr:helix-turn-helix domain-containing protein [Blautia sp. MSJ-9]